MCSSEGRRDLEVSRLRWPGEQGPSFTARQTVRDASFVKAYILTMDSGFFERPILNSPFAYPVRHWELDAQGQTTGRIIKARRTAQFITPIPRPKKHKG